MAQLVATLKKQIERGQSYRPEPAKSKSNEAQNSSNLIHFSVIVSNFVNVLKE